MSDLVRIDMAQLVREATGDDAARPNLVTRPRGGQVRDRIEAEITARGKGRYLLDFSSVGIVDFSGADETLGKIIGRLMNNEYGEVSLVIAGLEEQQEENVEAPLRDRKLPCLLARRDGSWKVLGSLNNYLAETLDVVMEKSTVTAKELSERLGLPLKTGSTRLINLHKARMVWREEEGMEAGGRQFFYHSLLREAAHRSHGAPVPGSHGAPVPEPPF